MSPQPQSSKPCDHCGETFTPKSWGRAMRFCSAPCRQRWWLRQRNAPVADRNCAVCGSSFTPAKYAGDRAKYCSRTCAAVAHREGALRRSWLKRQYGISLERYEEMFAAQGGRCAICGTDDPSPHNYLSVDHDHKTGDPRALLCNRCNVGIGRFGDDVDLLRKAVAYLEAHR